MPLLAPGDVAEKAAAVEHFMAGCNRRAGRPGRAGQRRGLPSGRSLGSAGYRRFRPRPRGQPPRRRAVQDQRLTADSCGGSRRLAPGPEVQPGRTAFPFHPLARDRRRTTLSLSLRGGQTADPIGFARVASAPIGALCVSCLCANMTCTMRSRPITRQAIFCTGRDDVFVYAPELTKRPSWYA